MGDLTSNLSPNSSISNHVDFDTALRGLDQSSYTARENTNHAERQEQQQQPLLQNQEQLSHASSPVQSAAGEEGLRSGRFLQTITRNRNTRQLSISPSPHPQTRAVQVDEEANRPPKDRGTRGGEKVTWSSLPCKGQLAVLTLARLAEPLTQTSLQSYLYYQLESFDASQTPSQITSQAGVVIAAFAAAQAVTAVFWGTVADATWGGRKFVIIVGLCGTGLGSLGYGFSSSWQTAVFWRVVSGSLNGNVGVMRTMISEIVREKKFLSRAFLLLPMCFNVGVIIGPLLGGLLADPVGSYPNVFGPGTSLGGEDGVWWMLRWPYSLPNTVSSIYLFSAALMVWLWLEETHEVLRERPDFGIRLGRSLVRSLKCIFRRTDHDYTALADPEAESRTRDTAIEPHTAPATPVTPLTPIGERHSRSHPPVRPKLPFRRLWTRNVIWTLTSHFLLAMCVGTFNALWFLFLSAPRYNAAKPRPSWLTQPSLPFHFTGGLGLPPPKIGAAMAVLGFIGITLQLTFYPWVAGRIGTLRAFQLAVLLFPLVYIGTPFLSVVPSTGAAPPAAASGVLVWLSIACVLAVQVLARTFALPATAILINNASPHPSVLGTVHGIAQSASSAARTFGPVGAGWVFGRGLEIGVGGLPFWIMACIALVEVCVSWTLKEGDGHEIWLPGEKESESMSVVGSATEARSGAEPGLPREETSEDPVHRGRN